MVGKVPEWVKDWRREASFSGLWEDWREIGQAWDKGRVLGTRGLLEPEWITKAGLEKENPGAWGEHEPGFEVEGVG